MYRKFFTSATFILSLAALLGEFIILFGLRENFFGLKADDYWSGLFFFSAGKPWAHGGIPFFTSLFWHPSTQHFLSNILLFPLIAYAVEAQIGRLKLIILFFLIHLSTLLFISIEYNLRDMTETILLSGLSASLVGMLAAYFFIKRKRIFLGFLVVILFLFAFLDSNEFFMEPHLVAAVLGIGWVRVLGGKLPAAKFTGDNRGH